MFKLVAAILAAALVAGIIVTIIPAFNSNVEAHILVAKGDRLELKTYGVACSAYAWPHFETTCLRDTNSATRGARAVRIVRTDRLPDPRGAANER